MSVSKDDDLLISPKAGEARSLIRNTENAKGLVDDKIILLNVALYQISRLQAVLPDATSAISQTQQRHYDTLFDVVNYFAKKYEEKREEYKEESKSILLDNAKLKKRMQPIIQDPADQDMQECESINLRMNNLLDKIDHTIGDADYLINTLTETQESLKKGRKGVLKLLCWTGFGALVVSLIIGAVGMWRNIAAIDLVGGIGALSAVFAIIADALNRGVFVAERDAPKTQCLVGIAAGCAMAAVLFLFVAILCA
ncbi:hypothetical protein [Bifidobacterium aerophilum]|uniref:Uncharacterized protein n=1 Tax=Bifidobacterium aerophilum TaxID=1798155 RepID=A0A6N9Z7N1_9BIFI|nr:hypothetical protein [Bifidobacterium aerophilum]NEG90628.1 hypothetical protein [Bifidobacterium aerophilum]